MATDSVVYLECLGGPYDGSSLPAYTPTITVRQFERSPYLHVYTKVRDDDGSSFFAYRGDVLAVAESAA